MHHITALIEAEYESKVSTHNISRPGARFTPNSRGTWNWPTTEKKNHRTRGYSGVGRQGRMFLLCYSPEGHKLLLTTEYNNSVLLAIEIDKLHDRF